jgi:2-iminobutanoate/2-iminopropanoate deaminase
VLSRISTNRCIQGSLKTTVSERMQLSGNCRQAIFGRPPRLATYLGVSRGLVWTSGQTPVRPDGSIPESFAAQVETVFDNLELVLRASGADLTSIIKITGYVTDMNHIDAYNEVYRQRISSSQRPARTTVQVASFRGPTLIEIEAVAYVL